MFLIVFDRAYFFQREVYSGRYSVKIDKDRYPCTVCLCDVQPLTIKVAVVAFGVDLNFHRGSFNPNCVVKMGQI